MQTFLPYPDFEKSAKCLDYRRLGKQRVEAWQIYLTLQKIKERDSDFFLGWDRVINPNKRNYIPWEHHPIVKMWKGYDDGLCYYGICMCNEWRRRGYKDTLGIRFLKGLSSFDNNKIPLWIGNSSFHASHRSNLLRKFPEHYRQFGWKEPNNLPYVWII